MGFAGNRRKVEVFLVTDVELEGLGRILGFYVRRCHFCLPSRRRQHCVGSHNGAFCAF